MITAKTKLCMVVGSPVAHSLSPQMHNAAFQVLGLPFVYVACETDDIKKTLEAVRTFGIVAVNVTVPHKVMALQYVDEIDKSASAIGATNLIILKNKKLYATNTDTIGALKALEENVDVSGKKVAILGTGGAARAIMYGLKKRKSVISVWNRTKSSGDTLAKEFDLHASFALSETQNLKHADIIINTTPVGMEPDIDNCPIPTSVIHSQQTVFDIVYSPSETTLLKFARKKGAKRIFGYKMLLYGGAASFEAITGKKAPIEVMEETLLKYLK